MRKPMTKYWVFDELSGRVHGPYWLTRISAMRNFGPDMKVAPHGATKPDDWKKLKDIPEFQKALEEWARTRPDAPTPPAGGDFDMSGGASPKLPESKAPEAKLPAQNPAPNPPEPKGR